MKKKDPTKRLHVKCPICAAEFTQDSMKIPGHIDKSKIGQG
jgi:hypothetical protein